MLVHSTALPLDIDYSNQYHDITAEDEKGAILALSQRDRVRCVRLDMPVTSLQTFVVAIIDVDSTTNLTWNTSLSCIGMKIIVWP